MNTAPATDSPAPELSFVIPVFRAEATLRELVEGLESLCRGRGQSCEIVMVEDCGGDGSWDVIAALCGESVGRTGIRLSRNYGQHNALLAGIRAARGAVIVTIDDDLQHPPDQVPVLLDELARGHDVVYGAPEQRSHGLFRALASQITKRVLRDAMGAETASQISAFRAFRAELTPAFADYHSPFVNLDVMLTWATTRFGLVRVRHAPRAAGRSGYTLRMLVRHALNMLTGFSVLPLQLASLAGFVFALFGFGVLAYVLGMYLVVGSVVPGFAFLASIVAIFSGVQLLAIGIIGEYLARIHFRTMDRPPYLVREVIAGKLSN